MTTTTTTTTKRARLDDGDTFTHKGYQFKVSYEGDEFMGAPWEEHDGHGPVSDWTRRAKLPGERILTDDRGSRRYYDIQAAMKIARRDQWGSAGDEGLGPRAKAARAVEKDYEYLRAWCNDEWQWTSVDVVLLDDDGQPTKETDSVGGIDGDWDGGEYLTEVAYQLADEIVARIEVDDPDVQLSEN